MSSVYTDGFSITPNDSTELPRVTNAIYVGANGTLSVVMGNKNNTNTALTITAVAGHVIPIRVKKINATGTTATGIIGLI